MPMLMTTLLAKTECLKRNLIFVGQPLAQCGRIFRRLILKQKSVWATQLRSQSP